MALVGAELSGDSFVADSGFQEIKKYPNALRHPAALPYVYGVYVLDVPRIEVFEYRNQPAVRHIVTHLEGRQPGQPRSRDGEAP